MKTIILLPFFLFGLGAEMIFAQEKDPMTVINHWESVLVIDPDIDKTASQHPRNELVEEHKNRHLAAINETLDLFYADLIPSFESNNLNGSMTLPEKNLREQVATHRMGLSEASKIVAFRIAIKKRGPISSNNYSWINFENSGISIAQVKAIELLLGNLKSNENNISELPTLYADNLMALESSLREELDAIPKVWVFHKEEPSIIMEMENPKKAIELQIQYDGKRYLLLKQNYAKVYLNWKAKRDRLEEAINLYKALIPQRKPQNGFTVFDDLSTRIMEHIQEHIVITDLALNIAQNTLWSKEQLNFHISTYNNFQIVENQ